MACLSRAAAWRIPRSTRRHGRLLSTQFSSVEHVRVPCASSGDITLSLHNISHHDTATPLVIYIPPFSQPSPEAPSPLPPCFRGYPAAVINYRWQAPEGDERPDVHLQWPTPLHDVNFAYSWITANLGSGNDGSADPRPAYVYGSFLGASLAAGLALTESHLPILSLPMTIRGLVAYNGIYNWTKFLPDHPIHRVQPRSNSRGGKHGLLLPLSATDNRPVEEEGIFTDIKHLTPDLFGTPANLFDPFASACLFFHSANLHVPDDFTTPLSASSSHLTPELTAAIDALSNGSSDPFSSATPPSSSNPVSSKGEEETASTLLARAALHAKQLKPPRKGYLVFPPRHSTLRLPHTLFLYDSPSTSTADHHHHMGNDASRKRRRRAAPPPPRNSFRAQATDLAGLMLRSLDMHELRARQAAPWEWEAEGQGVDGDGDKDREGDEDGGVYVGGRSFGDEEDARVAALERRVQTFEVDSLSVEGLRKGELGLGRQGEEVVGEWLRERIDEDFGGEGRGEG